MNVEELDELTELEESITPTVVRQWLAAERWSLTAEKRGIAETWSVAPGLTADIDEVFVPFATTFRDYNRRFKALLADLSRIYNLPLDDLVEKISSVRSDIFFVRVGTGADGTIPFKQATALLGSIQKMVRAAATTAANPYHSHTGRRPAAVTEFIEDDLRFGHTKRGSFIITVAARLDTPPADAVEVAALEAPALTNAEGDSGLAEPATVRPFARQVMETLAVGLAATKHHLATGDAIAEYEDFEEARSQGMSLELVQSLLDIGAAEGLEKVDLSFQWAPSGPPAPSTPDHLEITADEFERIEEVRDRLILREEPQEETLIGRVAELARDEVAGSEETSITLEAEFAGRSRKIRVPLDPADYEWAIYAHRKRLPFTVTGTPVRRQRWALEGAITPDTRFLRDIAREAGDGPDLPD